MKLTGKFWWQWLWIWHLYKYCGNSQGLRLWDLQAVFIHNNNPRFPSTQYMVTNFENYQSRILDQYRDTRLGWKCPLQGETWHAICFSWFICIASVQDVSVSVRIHRRPHNESAPVYLSIILQSKHFMSLSDVPRLSCRHSTRPHSSGMLCAQHSRPWLTCSSESFHSPIL